MFFSGFPRQCTKRQEHSHQCALWSKGSAGGAHGFVFIGHRTMPPSSGRANHGETRIKGCIKYDLGNGFRLITVMRGDSVVLLSLGPHAEMQRWLDANDGLEPVVREEDQWVAFARPHRPKPWRVQPTTSVTKSTERCSRSTQKSGLVDLREATLIACLHHGVKLRWNVELDRFALRSSLPPFD